MFTNIIFQIYSKYKPIQANKKTAIIFVNLLLFLGYYFIALGSLATYGNIIQFS